MDTQTTELENIIEDDIQGKYILAQYVAEERDAGDCDVDWFVYASPIIKRCDVGNYYFKYPFNGYQLADGTQVADEQFFVIEVVDRFQFEVCQEQDPERIYYGPRVEDPRQVIDEFIEAARLRELLMRGKPYNYYPDYPL